MIKTFLKTAWVASTIMVSLTVPAQQNKTMNTNTSYEVAVWRAKEDPKANKELIIAQTNAALSKLDGFIQRTVYQSVDDPQLLFDWVEWETTAHAVAASEQMMKVPELQAFVGLITETVLFEHYTIADYHEKIQGTAPVVELVAYELKAGSQQQEFVSAYSSCSVKLDGYHNRYILANTKGENQWAEFVYWGSKEEAKQAAELVMQNPETVKVFEMVKELKLDVHTFKLFN